MPQDSSGPYRSVSRASRRPRPQREPSFTDDAGASDVSAAGGSTPFADQPHVYRNDSFPSGPSETSFSSSLNLKTPARSYYHRSFHGSHPSREPVHYSSQSVREQTAELASWALSDAASGQSELSPHRRYTSAQSTAEATEAGSDRDEPTPRESNDSIRPATIPEISEPVSPDSIEPPEPHPRESALARLIHASPSHSSEHGSRDGCEGRHGEESLDVPGGHEDRSTLSEGTTLLPKTATDGSHRSSSYGATHDLEGQQIETAAPPNAIAHAFDASRSNIRRIVRAVANPRGWAWKGSWRDVLLRPASYVPAVILGLLLNVLDALSYGMILFPLGQPIFAGLGPDGISMFYVSCIVSQLVYSCGGSIFKGGIGSEMIEVVPFFHKMAFTILARVGENNPQSVLATTILSYSISSVITGAVFFLMGACRLGSLVGFFPRHILIGCIGGVGWFLVATGVEVSARLDGNLEYNLSTLQKLVRLDTIFLWTIPLVLAVILMISQRWVTSSVFVPLYFLVIPTVFYFFVAAIPDLKVDRLRELGWIFAAPEAGKPWYSFYTLYDFKAVHWPALFETVPAMFALTFFGVLHVPINVPALGMSTGNDNLNVDRELIAHGISNALSGFAGSIQNYLVYTNSLLFMRCGGDSRVAGVMLAAGTFGIMVIGPVIIGYIPIMVVGALIFLLGIDLLREALADTWGRVSRLEYLTIIVIVVTMGAWDFVVGILVGIMLACVNFVVQTSRKSAIRAIYSGQVARSTVRRHPSQYQFLRGVGEQIQVAKLAGYLFFGTIVSVENTIRALLEDEAFSKRPIRFLVFDFSYVNGVDFSAAEAFTRINRILRVRRVEMLVAGLTLDTEVGRSLQNVGLFEEETKVQVFEDLNSALEHCENELLEAFYHRRDAMTQYHKVSAYLDVPKGSYSSAASDLILGSPRERHLQQVAARTIKEHDLLPSSKWSDFKQPLPLLMQTFKDMTDKNEDFWYRACGYFERKEYPAGTTLYQRRDRPNGFYVLEVGILRAEYDVAHGKYYESVVAGTTCGELPFFSDTNRTATVMAEKDSVAWLLSDERWGELQQAQPDVAQELLRIGLKLTSERMSAITSYVVTTAA